jgi:hypothetical protein
MVVSVTKAGREDSKIALRFLELSITDSDMTILEHSQLHLIQFCWSPKTKKTLNFIKPYYIAEIFFLLMLSSTTLRGQNLRLGKSGYVVESVQVSLLHFQLSYKPCWQKFFARWNVFLWVSSPPVVNSCWNGHSVCMTAVIVSLFGLFH